MVARTTRGQEWRQIPVRLTGQSLSGPGRGAAPRALPSQPTDMWAQTPTRPHLSVTCQVLCGGKGMESPRDQGPRKAEAEAAVCQAPAPRVSLPRGPRGSRTPRDTCPSLASCGEPEPSRSSVRTHRHREAHRRSGRTALQHRRRPGGGPIPPHPATPDPAIEASESEGARDELTSHSLPFQSSLRTGRRDSHCTHTTCCSSRS